MAASQSEALAAIGDLKAIVQQFNNLHHACAQFAERQAVKDYVSAWNNQPTYAYASDGSQGAADGTPNTSHPLVGYDFTAGDLSTAVGYLINDFMSFVENGAVNTADRRPAIIAVLD